MEAVNNANSYSVLNYVPCGIVATSNVTSYKFEPSNGEVPTINMIPLVEIKYINSVSNLFRDGYLSFDENEQEAIYKALGIKNWDNILSQKDIMDIILMPTKQGLQKIIDIQTIGYFERVRGVFSSLKQSGIYDISIRVQSVIEAKYDELRNNILKSKIVIDTTSTTKPLNNAYGPDEIEKLKKEIKVLRGRMKILSEEKDNSKKNQKTNTRRVRKNM